MNRRATVLGLGVALVALAVWRGACVLAGPDIDTDAYAHHMIARAILADPHDLAVHWVWLPLFHYAQVPLVALGGTMDHVRWFNVVLAGLLPLAVFRYVLRTTTSDRAGAAPDATALFAALVAAACPIAMQMGTTAQPEPLFALLVFFLAVSFQERRYARTGAALAAAVLLRYEAWACLAVVMAYLAYDGLRGHLQQSALAAVVPPLLAIGAWATLRRPVDGRWFGFLGQTHEFAANATGAAGVLARGPAGLLTDMLYYPVLVPLRVLGPVLALVPFGIVRTVRQQGARFVLVLASCLGFISLTWIFRSSLGLDRHFVVVVPLYAIFAAQGAAAIAALATRSAHRVRFSFQPPRPTGGREAAVQADDARIGRTLGGLAFVGSFGGLLLILIVWMGFWRSSIEHGFPERAELGRYLRTLPPTSTIFCDDATIEILSGLDRRRFDRHWIDDPHTWDLVERAAREQGVAYVATWRRKLVGHEDAGTLTFRAPTARDDESSGVAVLRVQRYASGAALRYASPGVEPVHAVAAIVE
jgi:hypothetical protein